MEIKGTVFNVQRYTIHDGPGVRTEFFLKGCPLRCKWCSNPESQKLKIQLGVYSSKCLSLDKCGDCLKVCPSEGALIFEDGKLKAVDYDKCTNCMKCFDECPTETIKQWGKYMTVEDCMKLIRKDKEFYDRSGGGVTVSGGDPLVQAEFVAELFKACKAEGYHTCFESDFYAKFDRVEKVLPYTDLFIADLKQMDSDIHKKFTGVPNEMILETLKKLSETGVPIIMRIPVVPGFNDTMENMEATCDFFLNEMHGNVRTLQLLSYMRMGIEKYESLGRPYPIKGNLVPDREAFVGRVREYAKYFNSRGIHCVVGTKEDDQPAQSK